MHPFPYVAAIGVLGFHELKCADFPFMGRFWTWVVNGLMTSYNNHTIEIYFVAKLT